VKEEGREEKRIKKLRIKLPGKFTSRKNIPSMVYIFICVHASTRYFVKNTFPTKLTLYRELVPLLSPSYSLSLLFSLSSLSSLSLPSPLPSPPSPPSLPPLFLLVAITYVVKVCLDSGIISFQSSGLGLRSRIT
jgi:hypothetical protein